jgi:hypothetical protein
MRLINKILIEGDTLSIFEANQQYGEFKVGDMVMVDENVPEAAIVKAGLQPKTPYEIKSFIDQGNSSVLAVFDSNLARKTNYMQGVFNIKYLKNTEVSEGSFNPMKGKKMYFHVLEDGGYGRIGHQGYYNTPEEAQKRADELSDMFPKSEFYVEAYPTKKEPVTVTMEEVKTKTKFIAKKTIMGMTEKQLGGLGKLEGRLNGEKGHFYNFRKNQGEVIADFKYAPDGKGGMARGQQAARIQQDNIQIDAKEPSNELTKIKQDSSKPISEKLKTWDDSTIEMVKSINEAKKAKTDPKDKKKADATNYGNKDMSDVDMVNPYELKKGIRIEMVDIEDYEKAMDKAVKKLKKDPMFYSNLIANVKETKGKRSDVPTEVKDKKLNKVSDKLKDKANEMEVSKKDAAKKNANDSLNKKEKASGKPKGVKEMTMKPKASKGMKSMSVPGKEKKTNLKESFNLWELFKKDILR